MRPSRLLSTAGITLGLILPSAPAIVAACELSLRPPLEIEANPSDLSPPSAPTVTLVKVQRGDDWGQDDGCFTNVGTSCDGVAYVLLHVEAQDDTSPLRDLGYLVETTSTRFDVSATPVRSDDRGEILVSFHGTDNGEADLRATLEITAVDKAGNISLKSTPLKVTNKGSGCRVARNTPTGLLWTLAMLLTLMLRQRRHNGLSKRFRSWTSEAKSRNPQTKNRTAGSTAS